MGEIAAVDQDKAFAPGFFLIGERQVDRSSSRTPARFDQAGRDSPDSPVSMRRRLLERTERKACAPRPRRGRSSNVQDHCPCAACLPSSPASFAGKTSGQIEAAAASGSLTHRPSMKGRDRYRRSLGFPHSIRAVGDGARRPSASIGASLAGHSASTLPGGGEPLRQLMASTGKNWSPDRLSPGGEPSGCGSHVPWVSRNRALLLEHEPLLWHSLVRPQATDPFSFRRGAGMLRLAFSMPP